MQGSDIQPIGTITWFFPRSYISFVSFQFLTKSKNECKQKFQAEEDLA